MVTKGKSKSAAKTKDEPLRDYELIFIISPEVEEEKMGAAIDNVTQFITGKGGTTPEVEQWGKRKLAFSIKRFTEGSYVLARFKMKPELTKELEANLQISEEVLRHLLVKLED